MATDKTKIEYEKIAKHFYIRLERKCIKLTAKNISDELDLPIGEQGKLTKIIDDLIDGNPVEMSERRVTLKYKNTKILILMVWSEKHGSYISTSVEWEK